jgi:catechol 2,3-dioxygenase-like lactoylglutathione lyase family enzyme
MSQQIGKLHHLAICVSDMQRSEKFYTSVLEHLSYTQAQRMKDPAIPERVPEAQDSFIIWTGPSGAISIWPANPDSPNKHHDMYSPGLHHLALAADSREQVDDLHAHLQKIGAKILSAPAEYDYMPGFYAVFFTDPDGIKLELAHTPDFPPG